MHFKEIWIGMASKTRSGKNIKHYLESLEAYSYAL